MARRKRVIKRKSSRRRSRLGAIGKSTIMDLAYNVVGGVAAKYASAAINSALGSTLGSSTKLVSDAAPVIIGLIMPKKSPLLKGIATGMQVVGAVNLVSGLTGMAGVGLVPNAGFTMPTVGAIENMPTDERSMRMDVVAGAYMN
jgi:hypothetical protein